MRLLLSWPEGWSSAGISVEIGEIVPVPDDARGWILASLGRGLPDGARLGEPAPVAADNDLGWPMEVHVATVVDGAGRPIEARAAAFYRFLEYAGHALARARDPAALEARTPELLAAFRSGRPEWRGAGWVAAISELWDR